MIACQIGGRSEETVQIASNELNSKKSFDLLGIQAPLRLKNKIILSNTATRRGMTFLVKSCSVSHSTDKIFVPEPQNVLRERSHKSVLSAPSING